MKTITGFNSKTAENLLLDSGAFFLNFIVGTDTYESAKTAGKLIGATQGGGSFSAVPTIRQIAVDGVRGKAKGLERIDEWVVNMSANILEATKDVIMTALTAFNEESVEGYTKITPKNDIELTDYVENITWVGTLSGSDNPVIIQVYNAINDSGLSLNMADKSEGIIALNLSGHYDYSTGETDVNPPFAIYYPDAA